MDVQRICVFGMVLLSLGWPAMAQTSDIPAECLLLHDPWTPKGGGVLGRLKSSPKYLECDELNVRNKAVPDVVGCYLKLTAAERTLKQIKPENPAFHRHWVSHGHPDLHISGGTAKHNMDRSTDYVLSEPEHAANHMFPIEARREEFGENSDLPDSKVNIQPRTRELNAYYTLSPVSVPMGTVMFFVGEPGDLGPKWEKLTNDAWAPCLVRIVSCVPKEEVVGNDKHGHFASDSHDHPSGDTKGQAGFSGPIDPGDDLYGAWPEHGHAIDIHHNRSSLVDATHIPESFTAFLIRAKEDDAEIPYGAVLPWIPNSSGTSAPGLWLLLTDEIASAKIERRFIRSTNEEPVFDTTIGEDAHSHKLGPHTHRSSIGKSNSNAWVEWESADQDIVASLDSHKHESAVGDADASQSSEVSNDPRHAEVNFIIYRPF